MSTKLFLVRHGETYWNKSGVIHGQYDIPLNYNGICQAKNVANKLKNHIFDICICSPLTRAKMTANEILALHPNTPIIYDDRLKEINLGILEGSLNSPNELTNKESYDIIHKYQVESKEHFLNRIKSFYDDVLKKYKDKKILIVAHCGSIRMSLINFYSYDKNKTLEQAYFDIHIDNCSVQELDIDNIKGVDNKMKIGIYPMVADILHTGHMVAIEEAKKHCDYLIVALHCCPNYKKPVQTIFERFMQLRAVKWVDEIIPYTDVDDAKTMLLSTDYDVYFLGEDHRGTEWECSDIVNELGKEVYYLKRKHSLSSTHVKNQILSRGYNNDVEKGGD